MPSRPDLRRAPSAQCFRAQDARPRARRFAQQAPAPIDQIVGANLRLRRESLAMSRPEFAAAFGLDSGLLQKYENGTRRIGAAKLMEFAARLAMPLDAFFSGTPARQRRKRTAADTASHINAEALMLQQALDRIRDRDTRKDVGDLVLSFLESIPASRTPIDPLQMLGERRTRRN